MYWKISSEHEEAAAAAEERGAHGRFVLHRHHDAEGPHLDLRFEQDGYLAGFRIDGTALADEVCASEKGPHSIDWLERDGDAVRADAGTYSRVAVDDNEMRITLHGADGTRVLHAMRAQGLSPNAERDVCEALRAHGACPSDAARLIADGIAARRRAVDRLCGLARELDGAAFEDEACKRALAPLSLDDIHAQLRAYEVRFDAKYPPAPVSRPERLAEERSTTASPKVLDIVRG